MIKAHVADRDLSRPVDIRDVVLGRLAADLADRIIWLAGLTHAGYFMQSEAGAGRRGALSLPNTMPPPHRNAGSGDVSLDSVEPCAQPSCRGQYVHVGLASRVTELWRTETK